jgi:hypothetical protein
MTRTSKGRFAPGTTGNAGGRPKSLATLIEPRLNNEAEIIDFYLDKFRTGTAREKFEAAEWLSDRLYGKAVQAVAHAGEDGRPLKVVLTWGDDARA